MDIPPLLEPKDDTPTTKIMSMTLENMRKDYKDDADIMNELTNSPEAVIDFDRTWNGKFEFVRCGECNGPMLGHRAEKM